MRCAQLEKDAKSVGQTSKSSTYSGQNLLESTQSSTNNDEKRLPRHKDNARMITLHEILEKSCVIRNNHSLYPRNIS